MIKTLFVAILTLIWSVANAQYFPKELGHQTRVIKVYYSNVVDSSSGDSGRVLMSNGRAIAPSWAVSGGSGNSLFVYPVDTILNDNTQMLFTAKTRASPSGTIITSFVRQPHGVSVAFDKVHPVTDTPSVTVIGIIDGERDTASIALVGDTSAYNTYSYNSQLYTFGYKDLGAFDSLIQVTYYGSTADSLELYSGPTHYIGQNSDSPAMAIVNTLYSTDATIGGSVFLPTFGDGRKRHSTYQWQNQQKQIIYSIAH